MRISIALLGLGLLIGAAAAPAWCEASVALDDAVLQRTAVPQAETTWTPCGDIVYSSGATALRQPPRKRWRVMLAGYLWATDIKGTSYSNGAATDIDIEFSDLFDKLESAFMGYAEFGYDRWSLAVDTSFVSLKSELTLPFVGAAFDTTLDQTLIDLRLGYQVWCKKVGSSKWGACCHDRMLTVDAVLGARYWHMQQDVRLVLPVGAPVSGGNDTSWWDPYVGARARWQFAKRWGVGLYADIGGFDIGDASALTWQVQALLRFHITRGFFLTLGYRVLDVDRVEGSGLNRNGIDATYPGPALGLGVIF